MRVAIRVKLFQRFNSLRAAKDYVQSVFDRSGWSNVFANLEEKNDIDSREASSPVKPAPTSMIRIILRSSGYIVTVHPW